MPDFFVSRNKADKAWAQWIAWQLEAAGYETVVQDWDFGAGKNFVLEMQGATTNAGRTIAVLSPDFLKSAYTAPEWAAAFAQDPTGAKRKLVPVRVRDCKPTGLLAQIVYIDLVGLDEEAAKAELLAGVKRRAKPSTAPPFPGKGQGRRPKFPGPASTAKTATKTARRPTTRSAARPAASALTSDQAKARIDQHAWGVRRDRGYGWTGDVWLGAVIVPERQATPYIDVLDLGNQKLHEQVTTLALVGSGAIFRRARPTKESEQSDHVLFEQTDDRMRGTVTSLEVHADGTLVYRTVVERQASQARSSLADSIVIDEDAVKRAIAGFVTFAGGFYKRRRRDPGSVYLGVSLSDIAHKHFGRLPSYPMNTFQVGSPRLDDPLRVPASLLKITPAQLAKPATVAQKAVDHIARAFRLENAYFTP